MWRHIRRSPAHDEDARTRAFLSVVAFNVFLFFWQHVQHHSCLIVLRASIRATPRSTGEEPPDIQEINSLPPNLYLKCSIC